MQVLLSVAEHHSNLVPWQLIAKKTGAVLRHVPLTKDTQEIDMQAYHELLNEKTKLVSLVYISNVLGCVLPVQQVSEAAKKVRTIKFLTRPPAWPSRRIYKDIVQQYPSLKNQIQKMSLCSHPVLGYSISCLLVRQISFTL